MELSGPARVVDGDSLVMGTTSIELWGYDAPEPEQTCSQAGKIWPCGLKATSHLAGFIGNKSITCKEKPQRTDGTRTYKCALGTLDIGAEMIEVGLAIPNWSTSKRYYIRTYQEARGKGRGMHRGSFEMPWDWRNSRSGTEPRN